MKVRIQKIWEDIRSSYWFLPGIMAALAFALSLIMVEIDQRYRFEWVQNASWIWSGGADGARGILSTVAGSMITVASLTFSITIVAFTQASSQFGPRLLRSLMRDTSNQIVLGTFVATFIYCLLVLRTVRSGEGEEFVPHFSVTFALLLALASLCVLIYFIHHAALSIQAPHLIARVADDLHTTIDRLYPEEPDTRRSPHRSVEELDAHPHLSESDPKENQLILAEHSGYLQGIDMQELGESASRNDLYLVIKRRPGQFIIKGEPIVLVLPGERSSSELAGQIRASFIFGSERTYTQDVEFAIEQLVEVAVRSLSTGINDPFTAMNCIDWLGSALTKAASKIIPPSIDGGDRSSVRVVLENPVTFKDMVDAAFNQIRQNSRANLAVKIRLLETIAAIMDHTEDPGKLEALSEQAKMIAEDKQHEAITEQDREDLVERFHQIW